ncbi:MAG: hypothetical protein HYX48_08380 [Chlamydiales bacterium]|nr:hypothetical protein [Chlamydiales bacterium]
MTTTYRVGGGAGAGAGAGAAGAGLSLFDMATPMAEEVSFEAFEKAYAKGDKDVCIIETSGTTMGPSITVKGMERSITLFGLERVSDKTDRLFAFRISQGTTTRQVTALLAGEKILKKANLYLIGGGSCTTDDEKTVKNIEKAIESYFGDEADMQANCTNLDPLNNSAVSATMPRKGALIFCMH